MNYEPIEEHHNKRAIFRPQTRDDTTPCVELAGIQIYTYLHRGQLRISIHYDTAEAFLLDENNTIPTEISVGGTIVYDSHHPQQETPMTTIDHHDTSLTIPAVGISVLVFNPEGHLLLSQRRKPHGHGEYGAPGGGLDHGETPPHAAAREALEEAGIIIGTPTFLCLTNFILNGLHYLDVAFTAHTKDTPQDLEPDTHGPWAWHPLDTLPAPLFLPTAKAIQSYTTGRMFNW